MFVDVMVNGTHHHSGWPTVCGRINRADVEGYFIYCRLTGVNISHQIPSALEIKRVLPVILGMFPCDLLV